MATVQVQRSTERQTSSAYLPDFVSWSSCKFTCLLLALGSLPYANTVLNSFVYDDTSQIVKNPYIRSFHHLSDLFVSSPWSFAGHASNYYRPLMSVGYLFCYKLFGLHPYGFHLANLALHTAVVCFVSLLTELTFRNRRLAFMAAAVFALHPIHTEAVAWVAAVTELEVTLFYLLTFWFFIKVGQEQSERCELNYAAMAGTFVLALLSKEQALTLPLLATIYEHWYRDDRTVTTYAQKFSRYRILWLLALGYVAVRAYVLGAFAPRLRMGLTGYESFLSGTALVGQYLWKLVWPVRLIAFYVFNKSTSLLDPRVLEGAAVIMSSTVLFLVLWKYLRIASFAIVWMFATLAPVLNPQWLGHNAFAERYLYLPSVGFCWLVACGLQRVFVTACSRRLVWRHLLVGAIALTATLCFVRIVLRNRDWQNDISLYTTTLTDSPDAQPIRMNLAIAYKDEGDFGAAERELLECLQRDANEARCLSNLGALYIEENRNLAAEDPLVRAIRQNPKDASAHINLGIVYMALDSLEQAQIQLLAGVALAPMEPQSYVALGRFQLRTGQPDLAEQTLKHALAISPWNTSAHLALANLYEQMGRTNEAAQEYRTILEMDSSNWKPVRNVAR